MSNEELATAIQKGRTDLLPRLWQQVVGYVRKRAAETAAKLSPGYGVTVEDLTQSGYLALVAAVEKYEPERGVFLPWLDLHLRSGFAAAGGYRTTRRDPLNEARSLDGPLSSADGESETTFVDTLPDERDDYADADERIYNEQLHTALDRALDTLPDTQADVLRERYWSGAGLRTIAENHGISIEAVRQRERAGLSRLRTSSTRRSLEAFLDENTNFYTGTGAATFVRSGSAVENSVLRREELTRRWHCDTERQEPEQ